MSSPKSTARRLALLSGSSLAAALLVALAPDAASAQAVCLVPLPTTGAGTNTVNYAAGTYNPGINCTAAGGTMTVTTSGTVTVSSTTGTPGVRVPNGVNLTATGADGITWISAAQGSVVGGTLGAGAQINGALLDVLTAAGDISITTGQLNVAQASLTHGILAQSTGGGDIFIDARGGAQLSTSSGSSASAVAGIEARTTTGSITINAGAVVSGGARATAIGILTESSGEVIVNLTNANLSAAIIAGRSTGQAMRGQGTGSVELNVAWTTPLTSNDDEIRQRGIAGSLNFASTTGGAVVNIGQNATWELTGLADSVFGSGADEVNIADGGYMFLRALRDSGFSETSVVEDRYVVDFGAGADSMTNEGMLLIGYDESVNIFSLPVPVLMSPSRYEGELRLLNLTTFTNAGDIYFGSRGLPELDDLFAGTHVAGTDLWADDILALPGAQFVGQPGSRLFMDVLFNATQQDGCDASLRDTAGDLAADCMDLRGGEASGQTLITFGDALVGDRGAYNPDGVVLIDVTGGTAAPDAFVLDPAQAGYGVAGAVSYYDKGLFAYVLAYDDAAEQFGVYGVTAPVAQQYPLVATAAGELWRTAAGSWLEARHTGLPGADRQGGVGGGVWMRVSGASIDRDVTTAVAAGPTMVNFDNGYTQRNLTVSVGLDLTVGGWAGVNWLVGAMAGYARSDMEFDQSANVDNLEGAHAGVYGSLTAGAFFLDASFNSLWLTLDSDTPALNLTPAGTMVSGGLSVMGAQAEAGWRLAAGPLSIEPLASLSYGVTTLDDLVVPAADPLRFGALVEIDDVTNLRAGAGVRLSLRDLAAGVAPTSLSLTAKAISETDGAVEASILNVGPFTAPVGDSLEGTFSEVTGSVSVTNVSRTVAGYLNLNGLFGDGYRSVGVSAGFRYQW